MGPLAITESLTRPVHRKKMCGIDLADQLTALLEQAAAPLLTRPECQIIIKSLMIFSFETPLGTAENLFKLDQVSKINSLSLDSLDQMKHRNWQWIFFVSSSSNDVPLEQVLWRKSKAVQMGRLMMKNKRVSFIVGYWIHKLYQGRYPNILSYEFPECVKMSYYQFLKWQGVHWNDKHIHPRTLAKVYSFLYDSSLSPTSDDSSDDVGSNKGISKNLKDFWTNLYCLVDTLTAEQIGKLRKNKKKKSHSVKENVVLDTLKNNSSSEKNAYTTTKGQSQKPFRKRFSNNDYFCVTYSNFPVMKLERIKIQENHAAQDD